MPEFKGNVAVETAPYWDKPLADIAAKMGKVDKSAYYLRKKEPFHVRNDPIANACWTNFWARTTMTQEELKAYVAAYRAKRISPEEDAMWQRGASNAGYHYLGCARPSR